MGVGASSDMGLCARQPPRRCRLGRIYSWHSILKHHGPSAAGSRIVRLKGGVEIAEPFVFLVFLCSLPLPAIVLRVLGHQALCMRLTSVSQLDVPQCATRELTGDDGERSCVVCE